MTSEGPGRTSPKRGVVGEIRGKGNEPSDRQENKPQGQLAIWIVWKEVIEENLERAGSKRKLSMSNGYSHPIEF